ncbi:MAG TPA: o-succinylbenzoate synthase [Terriglobales bacterium]|jgi:O-succinylbenzoate synthase|nr:o-succinylbenzoate synthase [Terriglobales bacterium]
MKIDTITLRELRMPLRHFFETSFGRIEERRVLLVTADCEGVEGWGECVAGEGPFFSDEWVETAWATIREFLAPSLLGQNIAQAKDCAALMARVRGQRMAKAALENSLWDAEAKVNNQPLWKLLGGTRKEIDCGVSIGIQDSHEQLLEKIETELTAGYQRIKVKVKPGWDVEVLAKIRSRWPKILLSCDANSAYRPSDLAHLKEFEQFGLLMIEQPLWHDDIFHHAKLQRELKTALCLDESIHHARDAETAIDLKACRIINIKVGRVGGFSEAIAVHDVCERNKIPVWCGGMLETGIGRAHNIALSTLPNFRLPGDVSAAKRYWHEDIVEPEIEVTARGIIPVTDSAGTGYVPKMGVIEKLTVRKEVIRNQA